MLHNDCSGATWSTYSGSTDAAILVAKDDNRVNKTRTNTAPEMATVDGLYATSLIFKAQ